MSELNQLMDKVVEVREQVVGSEQHPSDVSYYHEGTQIPMTKQYKDMVSVWLRYLQIVCKCI